jgi:hypothetical protein
MDIPTTSRSGILTAMMAALMMAAPTRPAGAQTSLQYASSHPAGGGNSI